MHTAVVILCVNSGAVLSFAWYLHYLSVSLFPSLHLPHWNSPAKRHVVSLFGIWLLLCAVLSPRSLATATGTKVKCGEGCGQKVQPSTVDRTL